MTIVAKERECFYDLVASDERTGLFLPGPSIEAGCLKAGNIDEPSIQNHLSFSPTPSWTST